MMAPRVPERQANGATAQVLFVVLLSVAGVTAALYATSQADASAGFDYLSAGGFAVAFFVLRLMALRLPQGDEVPITVMAGLCALGVLDVPEALASTAAVGLLDAAARFAQSPGAQSARRGIDAVRAVAVLGLVAPTQPLLRIVLTDERVGDLALIPILAVGLVYALLDVLTVSVQERLTGGASVIQGVQLLLRPLANVYLVHIAMAAVVLRVYPALGMWGFAIAVLMTLILQNSFNLYLRIRRAYGDTIEALAHAAELDRPHDAGHAQRVADLSIAVGRRMALPSAELEHLRYAALLHDLGRIGHPEDEEEAVHAARGADIVAQIPFLAPVAPLIAEHHERAGSPDAPLGADIIGVCSHYDRLRRSQGVSPALATLRAEESGRRLAVVEELDRVVRFVAETGGPIR